MYMYINIRIKTAAFLLIVILNTMTTEVQHDISDMTPYVP
jgi:hypothetical protein